MTCLVPTWIPHPRFHREILCKTFTVLVAIISSLKPTTMHLWYDRYIQPLVATTIIEPNPISVSYIDTPKGLSPTLPLIIWILLVQSIPNTAPPPPRPSSQHPVGQANTPQKSLKMFVLEKWAIISHVISFTDASLGLAQGLFLLKMPEGLVFFGFFLKVQPTIQVDPTWRSWRSQGKGTIGKGHW